MALQKRPVSPWPVSWESLPSTRSKPTRRVRCIPGQLQSSLPAVDGFGLCPYLPSGLLACAVSSAGHYTTLGVGRQKGNQELLDRCIDVCYSPEPGTGLSALDRGVAYPGWRRVGLGSDAGEEHLCSD